MPFIKDNRRINVAAPYTDPATGEKGIDLTRPENRARFGVTEIADPAPPAGYSGNFYYRTEQDDAPYVVYTPKSEEQIRDVLKAKVKALRDQKETEGFAFNGKVFDSDERSVLRITQAAFAAQVVGPTFTIDWTTADGSLMTLNQAAMLGLPATFASYANQLHQAAKVHKAAIEVADFDTLKTYDITTGWSTL